MARSDAPPLNATRRFSDWQVIAGMFRGRERGEGQTDLWECFRCMLETQERWGREMLTPPPAAATPKIPNRKERSEA